MIRKEPSWTKNPSWEREKTQFGSQFGAEKIILRKAKANHLHVKKATMGQSAGDAKVVLHERLARRLKQGGHPEKAVESRVKREVVQ